MLNHKLIVHVDGLGGWRHQRAGKFVVGQGHSDLSLIEEPA
jgi:hypothetical protein